MKISFIATVFNEESTIEKFLESIAAQSRQPDEVIIVDGGGSDQTVSLISNFKYQISKTKVNVLVKPGNRSVGRNEAITHAMGDIIVCSDAGNVLDKDWLRYITDPFMQKDTEVVAGYYKGDAHSVFEKCLVPYVLVMPDKVNPKTFLPATRSIAFKKSVWEETGGFNEKLSNNEDYVFAKQLQKANKKIVFAKDAIVYWQPRKNIHEAYTMFYRFALGDAESGVLRKKVVFIFLRYFFGLAMLLVYFLTRNALLLYIIDSLLIGYMLWAIAKNFKYVKTIQAFFYLPLLQLNADIAVIVGTLKGLYNNIWDTQNTH